MSGKWLINHLPFTTYKHTTLSCRSPTCLLLSSTRSKPSFPLLPSDSPHSSCPRQLVLARHLLPLLFLAQPLFSPVHMDRRSTRSGAPADNSTSGSSSTSRGSSSTPITRSTSSGDPSPCPAPVPSPLPSGAKVSDIGDQSYIFSDDEDEDTDDE